MSSEARERKIYLSVPSSADADTDAEHDVEEAVDKSFRPDAWGSGVIRAVVGKKEVAVSPEKTQQQISDYISMLNSAVEAEERKDENALRIQEVKLGLTVTVEGNIGVASTSAEAAIEIIFRR